MKIQIIVRKGHLRFKGKTLLAGRCQQNFENKKFVDISQKCFALLPPVTFPAHNLNFHWRWWDRIQAIFLNLFYFKRTRENAGEWKYECSFRIDFNTLCSCMLQKMLEDSSAKSFLQVMQLWFHIFCYSTANSGLGLFAIGWLAMFVKDWAIASMMFCIHRHVFRP